MPSLMIAVETYPVAGAFTISRGSRTEATVVVATLTEGAHAGRGECVPYAHYGETTESVVGQLQQAAGIANRMALQSALPAGAARNALDCAFWDLEAKATGRSVIAMCQLPMAAGPLVTCYTLSLDTPEAMAAKAREHADKPLLKLKLGRDGDAHRMRAVRAARPDARLVADANEGWSAADLAYLFTVAADCGLELIEQPLPADADAALGDIPHLVPVCADESVHTVRDLDALARRYDAINVKLDKAGGLTEALATAHAAQARNLKIMVGCMLSTSLAMAPAWHLAPLANWLDLDGPLLLARDRTPSIRYRRGHICAPPSGLWG